jgi:hypothetical protein
MIGLRSLKASWKEKLRKAFGGKIAEVVCVRSFGDDKSRYKPALSFDCVEIPSQAATKQAT